MRDFGAAGRQGTEILTPFRRDAARLGEKLLIEPFDVGRVGSLQVRRIVLVLEYCAHELGRGGSNANDYAAAKPEGARSVAKQPLSSNALASHECAEQPPFVGDQCDVGHKNTLQDEAGAHDPEQSCARNGDEHEHAAAGEAHFQYRKELGMIAQNEREQRIGFLSSAHDQGQCQKRVGHAE